ncbi:hypothetical protein [Pseudoxanthomonas gei]|uniref:hypothetical protein n=1 Tax=Pseudoxanthomonas gei TaxID=1383030 RepID=UPI001B865D56|nr:hypothetical protein [Pseudoxanthomonas gei]
MDQHFRFSSFREKLVEHLFVGELLRTSWLRGECSLEVAKPEVDSRGYDVIIERSGVVRHIQLKTSHREAAASSQKIHLGLAQKPSGCVVWIQFDNETLELGPFLFFGNDAGQPLPPILDFKIAKHTKGNASGIKAARPDLRNVPKSRFRKLASIAEVFDALFSASAIDAQDQRVDLSRLQAGLHKTIRRRIDEFKLESAVPLPRLTFPLPTRADATWFPVPGMYGGFSYWGEGQGDDTRLVIESWSRVLGGSGQRHEVAREGVRLIEEGFV